MHDKLVPYVKKAKALHQDLVKSLAYHSDMDGTAVFWLERFERAQSTEQLLQWVAAAKQMGLGERLVHWSPALAVALKQSRERQDLSQANLSSSKIVQSVALDQTQEALLDIGLDTMGARWVLASFYIQGLLQSFENDQEYRTEHCNFLLWCILNALGFTEQNETDPIALQSQGINAAGMLMWAFNQSPSVPKIRWRPPQEKQYEDPPKALLAFLGLLFFLQPNLAIGQKQLLDESFLNIPKAVLTKNSWAQELVLTEQFAEFWAHFENYEIEAALRISESRKSTESSKAQSVPNPLPIKKTIKSVKRKNGDTPRI